LRFNLISACVKKGERIPHTQKGRDTKHHVECMHSFGRLNLFRGSCNSVAFTRCVEPLPLLEGLASFLSFRVLLVVLSPLPLLEGKLCFTLLRRVISHVYGDQVLLISNNPVLAFL
jgi:hypothetical protein